MAERQHKATYSRDKRKGGYLIRVEGPNAASFAGREIPVTLKDGTEHLEQLDKLTWTGVDSKTGKTVALYTFAAKPKEKDDEIPF